MSDEKHDGPPPDEKPTGTNGHGHETEPAWSPDWLDNVAEKKPADENAAPFEDFMSDWLDSKESKPAADPLPPIVTSNDDFTMPPLVDAAPPSAGTSSGEIPAADPSAESVHPDTGSSIPAGPGDEILGGAVPSASDDDLWLPSVGDTSAEGAHAPTSPDAGAPAEANWSFDDDDAERLAPVEASGSSGEASLDFETPATPDWSVDDQLGAEPLKGPGAMSSGLGSPAEVQWPASNAEAYDVEGGSASVEPHEIGPPPKPIPMRTVSRESSAGRSNGSPVRALATALGLVIAAVLPAAGVFLVEQNQLKASDEARKAAEKQSQSAGQTAEQYRKRADDLAKEAETLKADLKTAQEAAGAATTEPEKTTGAKPDEPKNPPADVEKQLVALKNELDAEKAKRAQAEQDAKKAERIAEEALAGAKKPAPGAAAKVDDAVAALKQAEAPEAVTQGLKQLIRTAFDADDPQVLESAASGLGDRAQALIKACEEAAANEQDPKLKARYSLFELLLHEENDKQAGDKQGAREGQGGFDSTAPVISNASIARPAQRVRRVALRVARAPGDSVDRLKAKLAIVNRVLEGDPEELSAYLRKGRLLLELGRAAQDAARNEDAAHDFDEAAKAFREGLNRLKQAPERDRGGKVALGLSEGFNEVLLIRPAATPASASDEGQGQLKAMQAQLQSAQAALTAARADLKTAQAERDQARRPPPAAPGGQGTALAGALADARNRLSTASAELAAARSETEQANRALAWERGADQHWAAFAAKTARLAGYNRPLPAAGPERSAWIAAVNGALEARLIEGTAPPEPAHPRTDDAQAAYSAGLEQMYQGNYPAAIQKLSEAIQWDPRDARFFYFRGIAGYLASGGVNVPTEAVNDVRRGAALERQALPSSYDVGRSLVRIQNQVRDWVESIRNPARQAPAAVR